MLIAKRAECIRNVANWSKVEKAHIFDQKAFKKEAVVDAMEKASPKLVALLNKIQELDEADLAKTGKQYKHIIFTDVANAQYGVKIIAAGMLAKGYKHAYDGSFEIRKDLDNKTFAVLCSTTIFGKPMTVRFRKQLLETFNARPSNTYGDKIRFVVLDRGFKEGIDIYDVKYVHLFEPLISTADEKQAVGRGTRYCGQRGLPFDPNRGWELHVYRYEQTIGSEDLQEKYDASRMFELFVKHSGIDFHKLVFANGLEKATVMGAVDSMLTKNVHDFGVQQLPSDTSGLGFRELMAKVGFAAAKPRPPSGKKKADRFDRKKLQVNQQRSLDAVDSLVPKTIMTYDQMQDFIQTNHAQFEWPKAKMENLCDGPSDGGGPQIVKFTPSQEFARHYFAPASAYKGMLLYHGVGSGKTCSAIAIASSSFERKGYTILWVTRHTLKAEIWKNMFRQVCSMTVRKSINNGVSIPEEAIRRPMKYASNLWFEPMSYRQFSNLLEGKNEAYHKLVARNGKDDPLRKTLIIIDEAHKLYAPDMKANERPNMETLKRRIHDSYQKSKKDSAKLLLMTATPYTTDPMDLIKMLNLMRTREDQMPEDFDEFQRTYKVNDGLFSEEGLRKYLDDTAGYVSYLNRERDARQFATPIFHNVVAPISLSVAREMKDKIREAQEKLEKVEEDIEEGKDAMKQVEARVKQDTQERLNKYNKQLGTKKEYQDKVRTEMERFQDELLAELNAKMAASKEEQKRLTKEIKALEKKAKSIKSDISQEANLGLRCFGAKK